MQNEWDTFWATGKIMDYLAYCTRTGESPKSQSRNEELRPYGTVSDSDRYGSDGHADWGI
jgi:hypothetical protein